MMQATRAPQACRCPGVYGTPQGTVLSRLHRGVGAIFLLRHDGAAGPLHGEPTTAARARRARRRDSRSFARPLESITGPLSTQALASQIFGLYAGLRVFHPAARRADRRSLDRAAQCRGAGRGLDVGGPHRHGISISPSCSHCCCWSPDPDCSRATSPRRWVRCIRRTMRRGAPTASWYSAPPSISARPPARLVCGLVAQIFTAGTSALAWPSIFMMLGLATYLSGYRHLPARVERARCRTKQRLTCSRLAHRARTRDRGRHQRSFRRWPTISGPTCCRYGSRTTSRSASGRFSIPIPWYQSIDALVEHPVRSGVAMAVALPGRARRSEPGDLGQDWPWAPGSRRRATWYWSRRSSARAAIPCTRSGRFCTAWVWGLPFSTTGPPCWLWYRVWRRRGVNSFMMGIVFTSLFLGNILTGWTGSLYEKMSPTEFWALHAAIGATGGLLVLILGSRLQRALRTEQV